jgi:hypothetical protein
MRIIDVEILPYSPSRTLDLAGEELTRKFFAPLHEHLYQSLNPSTVQYPHIDFDVIVKPFLTSLLRNLSIDDLRKLRRITNGISAAEWNKAPEHKALMAFLSVFPEFGNMILNVHLVADAAIRATEFLLGCNVNAVNFVSAKQQIDNINRARWSRPQTDAEQQSGVSNLGGISEMLLEKALAALIDNQNFFKTTNQKIQSYGDFVLMCLPNNRWLSVKSNFARERLLASGYTTDILGVGFFTDKREFISKAKIRNFQRVGFLAMYLPDTSVSQEQIEQNTNTYDQVMEHYGAAGTPVNINGTAFLRPLSQLCDDLTRLLSNSDISNRTTLDF